jgi:hypothetical protein
VAFGDLDAAGYPAEQLDRSVMTSRRMLLEWAHLSNGPERAEARVDVDNLRQHGGIALPEGDCIVPAGDVGRDGIVGFRGDAVAELGFRLEDSHGVE